MKCLLFVCLRPRHVSLYVPLSHTHASTSCLEASFTGFREYSPHTLINNTFELFSAYLLRVVRTSRGASRRVVAAWKRVETSSCLTDDDGHVSVSHFEGCGRGTPQFDAPIAQQPKNWDELEKLTETRQLQWRLCLNQTLRQFHVRKKEVCLLFRKTSSVLLHRNIILLEKYENS